MNHCDLITPNSWWWVAAQGAAEARGSGRTQNLCSVRHREPHTGLKSGWGCLENNISSSNAPEGGRARRPRDLGEPGGRGVGRRRAVWGKDVEKRGVTMAGERRDEAQDLVPDSPEECPPRLKIILTALGVW